MLGGSCRLVWEYGGEGVRSGMWILRRGMEDEEDGSILGGLCFCGGITYIGNCEREGEGGWNL